MPKFITSIVPEKTALLVVDMSNGFVGPDYPFCVERGTKFAPKINALLNEFRSRSMFVLFTTHVFRADKADLPRNVRLCEWSGDGTVLLDGTPDVEVYPVCGPKEGEIVLKKHHYSSFFNTDLDVILRANGVDTIVITGVNTDICCHGTATDAFFRSYKVIVLEDLNGTPGWEDCGLGNISPDEQHLAFINCLAATTAHVMSSDEFLSYLNKSA